MDERGDVGMVFKILVALVISVGALGLLWQIFHSSEKTINKITEERSVKLYYKTYRVSSQKICESKDKESDISGWNTITSAIPYNPDKDKGICIAGIIREAKSGKYVRGAKVSVYGDIEESNMAVTNDNGFFAMWVVPDFSGSKVVSMSLNIESKGFTLEGPTSYDIVVKAQE